MSIRAIAQFSIETDDLENAGEALSELRALLEDAADGETLRSDSMRVGVVVELDQLELEPAAPWLKVQGPGIARCERCGRNEPQPDLPLSIDALVAYMRYLVLRHVGCEAKA